MAIRIINRQKKIKLDTKRVRRSALKLLKELDCRDREVNILFTDDAGIREFNLNYLGKDKPTNVISFAMSEGEPCITGSCEHEVLGDIVISVETAERDGKKTGLALEHEIDFLMIHGILHLLGFDHVGSRAKAEKMATKEKELFFHLNGFEIE
jgi:probable rRNA maturation factor